ncbi:MAG: 2-methylcitrate dehydratase, partial [Acidobacteriales bacterium]
HAKFERAVATRFAPRKVERILGLFDDPTKLAATPACEFMDLWVV